jgi:hypothetical protein
MWPVALVVRLCARELLEHLAARRRRPPIIELVLASGKLSTHRTQSKKKTRIRGEGGNVPCSPGSGHSTRD